MSYLAHVSKCNQGSVTELHWCHWVWAIRDSSCSVAQVTSMGSVTACYFLPHMINCPRSLHEAQPLLYPQHLGKEAMHSAKCMLFHKTLQQTFVTHLPCLHNHASYYTWKLVLTSAVVLSTVTSQMRENEARKLESFLWAGIWIFFLPGQVVFWLILNSWVSWKPHQWNPQKPLILKIYKWIGGTAQW